MTAAPVMSINDELLDDLQRKAKAATLGPWAVNPLDIEYEDNSIYASTLSNGTRRLICTVSTGSSAPGNRAHIAATNPATVLALVEHIRSLSERLEKAEKDAKALNFMLAEECRVRGYLTQNGVRYGLIWDDLGESQVDLFTTQREAIDAAIAQEGQSHE